MNNTNDLPPEAAGFAEDPLSELNMVPRPAADSPAPIEDDLFGDPNDEAGSYAVLGAGCGTSPMPVETIDQAHERLGHTAPRVTLADFEANIVDVEIVKHVAKSGQVLRWAVITTRSGFALAGEPSASVSVENDSAELGEKFAIENARRALWMPMGYALRERLNDAALSRGGINVHG